MSVESVESVKKKAQELRSLSRDLANAVEHCTIRELRNLKVSSEDARMAGEFARTAFKHLKGATE